MLFLLKRLEKVVEQEDADYTTWGRATAVSQARFKDLMVLMKVFFTGA